MDSSRRPDTLLPPFPTYTDHHPPPNNYCSFFCGRNRIIASRCTSVVGSSSHCTCPPNHYKMDTLFRQRGTIFEEHLYCSDDVTLAA
ncbi:uncharacterized protein LOC120355181 isoform X2 [Nilaparvata lugens]|uniref:uncharacterized protein LOC120355181 isoform X2 n=1 Tax=Nilaparvata lugens TaxID=108931 RepID=UPI00193E023B|nr:uncharacterized protein LOC120355181 isoform X2 [Nilaparvata lugens]